MRPTLLVLLLWAAGLAAAAQFAKMSVILPELGVLYPQAGAAIGWLVSLISLIGIGLGLFAGVLAGRVGLRRLLLASLALGAAVSALQALLVGWGAPFHLMLASRVLEGLSHLGIVVAAPTLIAGIAPETRRGLAMTLWGTFFGVAFALVAWSAPAVVVPHGPGGLFAAHALAMAAVGAALALGLPRDEAAGRRAVRGQIAKGAVAGGQAAGGQAAGAPQPDHAGPAGLVRRHAAAYGSAFIAAPAIGWLFYTVTFVSLLTVLPGLVPPEARGFVATAMPLASIASSMTLGLALLRITSAVNVVLTGFALAVLVALALLAWPGEPWLAVALFAALGLVQGASFAAVPELNASGEDRALANGAMAQTGNLGNAVGTPLLLAVLLHAGWPAMVALAATCYLGGLAAHALLARQRMSATR